VKIEKKAEAYANEKWPGVGQIYWRSLIKAAWLAGHLEGVKATRWAMEKVPTPPEHEREYLCEQEVDFEFE